jgi:flagellar biosynthesis protein FlhG
MGPTAAEERADTSEIAFDPDAEVTGEFLRKVRQSRGIELGDISQRTKISERYLRALEDEVFTDMPAVVYVRGYIMEYARALRLDAPRVTESYLARYRKKNAAAPASSASWRSASEPTASTGTCRVRGSCLKRPSSSVP